jgi:hypothetical protein
MKQYSERYKFGPCTYEDGLKIAMDIGAAGFMEGYSV